VIGGDVVYNRIHMMLAITGPAEWQKRIDSIDLVESRDSYIRQLRDWKGIAVAEDMLPQGMGWAGLDAFRARHWQGTCAFRRPRRERVLPREQRRV